MTSLNELELSPEVVEAFAREMSRVCPGSPGGLLTVYPPEPGGEPLQFDLTPVSRPSPLPLPAV